MKKIPLTQNQEAIVDDEDYEWLMQWKWYAKWNRDTRSYYAMRNQRVNLAGWRQITVQMHREVLGLMFGDKRQGDHKNHQTLDNRRENLRIVTNQENSWNRKSPMGYCWDKHAGKYKAQITVGHTQRYLGYFDTAEQARAAYLAAKATYHKFGH